MVDLQQFIDRYYGSKTGFSNKENFAISSVVEEKINFLISSTTGNADLLAWKKLVSELSEGFTVQDVSYQQFPNLKLIVGGDSTIVGDFRISRDTYIIISLLCPLYTCFHQFRSEFVTKKGGVTIGSAIFLRDKLFDADDQTIFGITRAVSKFYPSVDFIYHMDLFSVFFAATPPWGIADSNKASFAAFEYLFDTDAYDRVFL